MGIILGYQRRARRRLSGTRLHGGSFTGSRQMFPPPGCGFGVKHIPCNGATRELTALNFARGDDLLPKHRCSGRASRRLVQGYCPRCAVPAPHFPLLPASFFTAYVESATASNVSCFSSSTNCFPSPNFPHLPTGQRSFAPSRWTQASTFTTSNLSVCLWALASDGPPSRTFVMPLLSTCLPPKRPT